MQFKVAVTEKAKRYNSTLDSHWGQQCEMGMRKSRNTNCNMSYVYTECWNGLGSALQTFFKEKALYFSFLQLNYFISNNSQNFYLV